MKSHQKDQQSFYDQMYSMNTQSLSPMTPEQYYQQVGLSIPMNNQQQMLKETDEIVLIKVEIYFLTFFFVLFFIFQLIKFFFKLSKIYS